MNDCGTQTPESRYGAELRFHFQGLSDRLALLVVLVNLLCLFNGLSYYLYWRNVFYARVDAPPVALYVTISGVFFLFVMAQLLIQLALRTMINQMSIRECERRIRCLYLVLVLSLLPSIVGHISLYAQGWFDTNLPFAAIFIGTTYFNVLVGACALSYVWTSVCVDWVHAGVRRAAVEKGVKMCQRWNEHLMYILTPHAPNISSCANQNPKGYSRDIKM